MASNQLGYTDSQWEVLKSGPVHMLKQVAGADSLVDHAEWSSLVEAVRAAAHDDQDELVHAVMSDLAEELRDGAAQEERDGFHALDGLRAVRLLLDSRDDKGAHYRETLMRFGATIAESSGAQLTRTFASFHGHGGWKRSSGTSAMEREALHAAAEALGVD
ncbi:MAG: hypothetical protein AB7N24_01255 [Dehalococcoidia bacterium]